ncbi:MAG: LPS export ABC transporter permease LptF [Pseudomonadota bacterium]
MIIYRYLLKECIKIAISVIFVLMLIFVSQQFVRFLGDFASGDIDGLMVLQLLSLQVPVIFSFLLPLALFIGTLMGLSRLYAESELTVMRACGIGQVQIAWRSLLPASLAAVVTGALTLFLAPWATEVQYQLMDARATASEVTLLQPGKFTRSADGSTMIYIQAIEGEQLENVVLLQSSRHHDHDKEAAQLETREEQAEHDTQIRVSTARKGQIQETSEGALLSLFDGSHYALKPGEYQATVDTYQSLNMKLPQNLDRKRERKQKALPTHELFVRGELEDWAEIQWRISVALSLPILVLIAIPLSRVNPRQGRFGKVLPAMILYSIYVIALLTLRSAIEKEQIPVGIGMWWVHIVMLAIALYLFKQSGRVKN